MSITIYRRGFLGFDIGLVVNKTDEQDFQRILQSVKLSKTLEKGKPLYPANPSVVALWKQTLGSMESMHSFENREKLLKTALRAFGKRSFLDWCILQEKSPFLTAMHKRFLNDTFNYLLTGKRAINILTWDRLLAPKEATVLDETTPYEYSNFFKKFESPFVAGEVPYRLSDVITLWCTKPGGFEDLLGTLHVLFGE